jgi:hypothetical protein
MKMVPARETLADLEKKARECEEQAKTAPASPAEKLKQKARTYRAWMFALKSGRWTS